MNTSIYQDIASRTGGDIYIGVVGPVRSGKSTFIKRFMETLVIPNIENVYLKGRIAPEWVRQNHYDGGAEIRAGRGCANHGGR